MTQTKQDSSGGWAMLVLWPFALGGCEKTEEPNSGDYDAYYPPPEQPCTVEHTDGDAGTYTEQVNCYDDYDSDGVNNGDDRCPAKAGSGDNNGCPEIVDSGQNALDSDGDGLNDNEDDCPNDQGSYLNYGCPEETPPPSPSDRDGDGFPDVADNCPDNSSSNRTDTDGDGIGDVCDPDDDNDGDGFLEEDGDCNDYNSDTFPGAEEICDYSDNDCDGEVDEGVQERDFYRDEDGDGYGNSQIVRSACHSYDNYVARRGDCDDTDANFYPGAGATEAETCDTDEDYNCNGHPLDNCYPHHHRECRRDADDEHLYTVWVDEAGHERGIADECVGEYSHACVPGRPILNNGTIGPQSAFCCNFNELQSFCYTWEGAEWMANRSHGCHDAPARGFLFRECASECVYEGGEHINGDSCD